MTMSTDSVLDSIALENLTWSQEEFTLSDFVDKFPLPQIVKVQEGYYGPDEDSCLGADQVLFLHALKHTDKVQARDKRRRELHIPLNCSQKLEVRPSKLKETFESVSELAKIFTTKRIPEYVRVTQGYDDDDVCINPGDKLRLIKEVSGQKDDCLVAESQDGSGSAVRIPLSASAGFQPLTDGREYYLKEAINMNPLPFFFQFIKPHHLDAIGEASVFNSTLGVLKAEKTYHDSSVICTTKEGTTRTVVSCPKKLQITVTAANGALIGDKEYMKVCKFFHDGVSLKRIENMECFNVFASRDTIREYIYDTPMTPKDQEGLPPPIPSRVMDEIGESNDYDDDDSDENHDYAYIPDLDITSLTFQKFDYEEFKSGFEEDTHEDTHEESSTENESEDNDEYEDMLYQIQPVDTQGSAKPVVYLQQSAPPPVMPKPPIVKPKPLVKVQGHHHVVVTTINDTDIELPDKKSQETVTSISDSRSGNDDQGTTSNTTIELQQMSISDVSEFLKMHRLTEFIEAFEYNQIDGEMLVSLDLDMMESLGMNNFQRKKMLKLIQGWRPKC